VILLFGQKQAQFVKAFGNAGDVSWRGRPGPVFLTGGKLKLPFFSIYAMKHAF
jgi:hypothetical protein